MSKKLAKQAIVIGVMASVVLAAYMVTRPRWEDAELRAYLFDDLFWVVNVQQADPGNLFLTCGLLDVSAYPSARVNSGLTLAKFPAGGPAFQRPEVYGFYELPEPLKVESFSTFLHRRHGFDSFHMVPFAKDREKFNLAGLMHLEEGQVTSFLGVKRYQVAKWGKLELAAVPCRIELHPCQTGTMDFEGLHERTASGEVPGIKVDAKFPYYLLTDSWIRTGGSVYHWPDRELPDGYECWYIVKNPYLNEPKFEAKST